MCCWKQHLKVSFFPTYLPQLCGCCAGRQPASGDEHLQPALVTIKGRLWQCFDQKLKVVSFHLITLHNLKDSLEFTNNSNLQVSATHAARWVHHFRSQSGFSETTCLLPWTTPVPGWAPVQEQCARCSSPPQTHLSPRRNIYQIYVIFLLI